MAWLTPASRAEPVDQRRDVGWGAGGRPAASRKCSLGCQLARGTFVRARQMADRPAMGRASDAALVACYLLPVTGATSARPEKGLCVVRHLRQHASLAGCAPASLERGGGVYKCQPSRVAPGAGAVPWGDRVPGSRHQCPAPRHHSVSPQRQPRPARTVTFQKDAVWITFPTSDTLDLC